MANPGDYVAAVRDTLTATADVCRDIDDLEWERPTGCPGWSVKDNVSHMCDVEHLLLGDPPAGVAVEFGEHVINPVGERMEPGVELRRAWPPSEVLADLEATTKRRIEQLADVSEPALEETAYGHPLGPMPLRTFLTLRVFDLFTHQQDIRRAVGRLGDTSGPAAQMTVPFATKSLARFLFDKQPELRGQTFVLTVDDITLTVELTGERAGARKWTGEEGPQLSFDIGNFMAWIGGRSDRADFGCTGESEANALAVAAAFRAHAGMTP
ncbi:MAG: hypothetical protein QOG53_2737 [Frankiales bacterium]|jgi:uncharacterized protein (TIGR03083 family)|nr:hypothetical protein [Frankiales bacterium]